MGFLSLNNRVNMESSTSNPDFAYFVTNYNTYKNTYKDYMVLQGHPNGFSASSFENFKLVTEFLLAEGCEFVKPYELYLLTSEKETPVSRKANNYKLADAFPNPFNPSTIIRYEIPVSTNVKLEIFDCAGRELEVLVDENQAIGQHQVEWNAAAYPSGVYFYRLQTNNYMETKKLLLLK